MNKLIKKILFSLGTILGVIVLVLGVYVGYVFGQYYRLDDNLVLEVNNSSRTTSKVELNKDYSISTYNIGFGAYNQDYTFFMDYGYMEDGTVVSGTEAKAFSKAHVLEAVNGAANAIKYFNPDFALFQEVDIEGHRSYNVNQYEILQNTLENSSSVYAENFHTAFLCYPLNDPMGKVNAGITTFSKYEIESSIRKSFTITDSAIGKLFDLDRCFSATYLPIKNSDKQFVLINVHMSAYDEGGKIRAQQMIELNDFLTREADKGNYVVAGGDFNHDLLTFNPEFSYNQNNKPFSHTFTQLTPDWLSFFFTEEKESPLDHAFRVVASDNSPTCRDADITWQPGINYVSTIDGFIVSSNVEVISHKNLQTSTDKLAGFAYSDHEPATMVFKLK